MRSRAVWAIGCHRQPAQKCRMTAYCLELRRSRQCLISHHRMRSASVVVFCHSAMALRARSIVEVTRRVIRYQPSRPDDASFSVRLRELAAQRRRFGYRRLGILLAREGIKMNRKKFLRIYTEEYPKVRRRGGRKRALGTWRPLQMPQGPNQRWSLDFVSDARPTADASAFRRLSTPSRASACAWLPTHRSQVLGLRTNSIFWLPAVVAP